MITEQERAELNAENDGYRNDFQRAAAVSSMRRKPDDKREARTLVQKGLFVAVCFYPDYCPITDGLIGESCKIIGVGDTREWVEAILAALPESFWDDESRMEIWPHRAALAPVSSAISETDEIPF